MQLTRLLVLKLQVILIIKFSQGVPILISMKVHARTNPYGHKVGESFSQCGS